MLFYFFDIIPYMGKRFFEIGCNTHYSIDMYCCAYYGISAAPNKLMSARLHLA